MKRLLMATVTMVAISGTAYAMPGHGMHGMGGPGPGFGEGVLRLLIKLDLTDSQKHEAALILGKYRDEGEVKRVALRKAMEGLREASEADVFDEDAVRTAFEGVAAAGEEMAVHGARLVAELRGILTPEQKAMLEERRAHRQEKRKGQRERRSSFLDEWIDMHSKVQEPQ
jgi:Spy/CpxP family protein refolding chaperone